MLSVLTSGFPCTKISHMNNGGENKHAAITLGSSSCSSRPLTFALPGEQLLIRAIRGGWDTRKRLKEMGIVPGEFIRISGQNDQDHLTVHIAGSQYTISKRLAGHIQVQ